MEWSGAFALRSRPVDHTPMHELHPGTGGDGAAVDPTERWAVVALNRQSGWWTPETGGGGAEWLASNPPRKHHTMPVNQHIETFGNYGIYISSLTFS